MENPQKQELKHDDQVQPDENIRYRGIKAMPFIIGNETFEKLGTIGTSSNLLVYLTTMFGMKSITAQNLVNVFQGSANLATLIGAFLSDTYFGRYYTLGFASVASFMGMVVLSLTAAIHSLHPCGKRGCNEEATAGQMSVLVSGLALLVIGAGGIRPCNLAFGADQFDPATEAGKRGISSFFNWYYFTFTFAMMVSMTVIVYVQSNISWALGLALPALLMFLSCAFFFVGSPIYVRVWPQGSPLLSVAQVVVAAARKRKLRLPRGEEDTSVRLLDHIPTKSTVDTVIPYTDQFRFLNKGGIITEEDEVKTDGSASNPWKLSSIQQAEEVKCILRVIPIWFSGIIYYVMAITLQNYVVFQALQSNRRFGSSSFSIPAASYNFFTMLSVTIWLPVYDRAIIPLLRRATRIDSGITLLQKIGVGIVISVLTMLLSGYAEHKRREQAQALQGGAISSMSGFWLVPQLVLAGLSEAFAMVGFVELYYKQVPERMRSIGGSFMFSGMAISSYFSSFLVSVVDKMTAHGSSGSWLSDDLNRGRLDNFYYLIAGLELVNLLYFLACAKWYKYKGRAGADAVVVVQKEQATRFA